MTLTTSRFGTIEYTDEDILTLKDGPLGFPGQEKYVVVSHKDGSVFRWLQSVDDPGLAFLVLDPGVFRPDYSPEMPTDVATELELTEQTPRIVYAIVSIPPGNPEGMTANLAGPIVVNAETRFARQVVVHDPEWHTKHPLTEALPSASEKAAA
jgi:flagellar assembly factor FliW